MKRAICIPLALSWTLLVAGCGGIQSALNPSAAEAESISRLWWFFCGVLSAIYLIVLAATVRAVWRGKTAASAEPILAADPKRERRMSNVVGTSVALTVVILFVLLVTDFAIGRTIHQESHGKPVHVKVTGHRWWWEVQYEDEQPSRIVTTANEIHVPVGRTVEFELRSVDVIHSFWAPNFNGKKDLIPGHPTVTKFTATKAGTYRGQCAEFCGAQHAHMRFILVAEPEKDFEGWLEVQRGAAVEPKDDLQKRGKEVFLNSSCVLCHSIAGTPAQATVGPNLTHVASRPLIAGASIPNTAEHLTGWVLDSQSMKPGVIMPQNTLNPEDLKAVVAYLENLK